MSEGPRDYDLNYRAANELEEQSHRVKKILERLAAHLAATQPQSGPYGRDLVEQRHVKKAAEILLDPLSSTNAVISPYCVFVSFSHEDEAFIGEILDETHGSRNNSFQV